jgi:hypothetical protein
MTEIMNDTPRMQVRATGWKVTVPPGTYFLGDPCYAVPDADWAPLLASCDTFERPVGCVRGFEVLAFGTRWGDGTYTDGDGNEYGVDAGLIGLTPMGMNPSGKDQYGGDLAALGQIVTFPDETVCTTDGESGLLVFGDVKIDTDPEQDEDD